MNREDRQHAIRSMPGSTRPVSGNATRRLLGFWLLWAFVMGIYGAAPRAAASWVPMLTILILYLAVVLWLGADRGRHRAVADQYRGFGFFILWPVLLPFYLAQTRGWRRALGFLGVGLVTGIVFVTAGALLALWIG